MAIKGCLSIAEYAIRKWMYDNGFAEGFFTLCMNGNSGTLKDSAGDTLTLVYDNDKKRVYVEGQE